MKIIDKNGRLFGKISFIDILVIIAVAVVVLVVGSKPAVIEQITGGAEMTPVEYQLVVRDIRELHADLFRVGDSLRPDGVNAPGVIVAVETAPAVALSSLTDGTYVARERESKVDLYITIQADCSFSNGRYYAGRAFELNVNQETLYLTKYATANGVVTYVKPVE